MFKGDLPAEARGLRLYRIDKKDELIGCELVMFRDGYDGVHTVLNRASISGRVEIEGEVRDHLADIYTEPGTSIGTVALDAGSYSALKNHWMRCKVERPR